MAPMIARWIIVPTALMPIKRIMMETELAMYVMSVLKMSIMMMIMTVIVLALIIAHMTQIPHKPIQIMMM